MQPSCQRKVPHELHIKANDLFSENFGENKKKRKPLNLVIRKVTIYFEKDCFNTLAFVNSRQLEVKENLRLKKKKKLEIADRPSFEIFGYKRERRET